MRDFDPVQYVSPSMLAPHRLSIHGNISLVVLFVLTTFRRLVFHRTQRPNRLLIQSTTDYSRTCFVFLHVTSQTQVAAKTAFLLI